MSVGLTRREPPSSQDRTTDMLVSPMILRVLIVWPCFSSDCQGVEAIVCRQLTSLDSDLDGVRIC